MRGVSWNLSQGGMQVEVSDVKPEEAVQLSFRLPVSGVAVDVVGVVAWQRTLSGVLYFTGSCRGIFLFPVIFIPMEGLACR